MTMEDLYGPTNVNACTGNGGLAAGISREGDITVLRWPSPSDYDHVDHLALEFYEPRMGDKLTAGIFAGLLIDGTVTWLREEPWTISQGYLSDEDSIVVTTFYNPDLDLTVRQLDFVLGESDVLARRYEFEPGTGFSPIFADLVLFENLDPCNEKWPLIPVRDWLLDFLNDGAMDYEPGADIVHHYRLGADKAPTIHFAIGADSPLSGWQCGREDKSFGADRDAFLDLADGVLSANTSAGGQVDAALMVPVDLTEGPLTQTFYFAVAADVVTATELLQVARAESSDYWLAQTQDWWWEWIRQAWLPDTDNEEIIRTFKRLLISILVGTDRESGMIVASISGQPPYYFDWPRDGAAMNHALDLAGYHEMVTAHNLYYTRIQRESGSYWMNYHPDGTPGGPLPVEIDADGIALWELWDHASFLSEPERGEYVVAVYPTIQRSADFLCLWRNPLTGLPLPSWELDSATPVQTLAGAAAVLAGMKAAVAAGEEMGEEEARLNRWRNRLEEITNAILAKYYDEEQGIFTEIGYGAAYLMWPAKIFPYDHPAIQDLAERMYEAQRAAIEMTVEFSSYNGVAMESIAHAWQDDPNHWQDIYDGMDAFIVRLPTPDTRHWGEGYFVVEGDKGLEYENHVAMPHLLTGSYHLIAAMKFFGAQAPPTDDDTEDDDTVDDDVVDDDLADDDAIDDDQAVDDDTGPAAPDDDDDNDDGCGCN
ncbi:MAG: hypothetical protein ACTSXZ_02360 [Alphaproteobacteria bacterium]